MLTPLQGQSQPLNLLVYLVWIVCLLGLVLACLAGSEHLSELIWRKGGFRFWHRKTNNGRYIFYCSQDKDGARQKTSRGLRDASQMERFPCGGHLTFTPSFLERTLTITLRHTHHEPYDNHELSKAVLEFIRAHKNYAQPAEIFRNIQARRKSVTLHQVYYQWHLANSKKWRRHYLDRGERLSW
jgi:hypothetical protein